MSIFLKRGDSVVGIASDIQYAKRFIPSDSIQINGACSYIMLDREFLSDIFNKGFVHRSAQRMPLNIEIHDEHGITKIQNMWFDDMTSFRNNDLAILEHVKWEAESIIPPSHP